MINQVVSTTVQHAASDTCAGIHCEIHQVDEPGPGYIGCGECLHLYPTRASLVWRAWIKGWELWWWDLRHQDASGWS